MMKSLLCVFLTEELKSHLLSPWLSHSLLQSRETKQSQHFHLTAGKISLPIFLLLISSISTAASSILTPCFHWQCWPQDAVPSFPEVPLQTGSHSIQQSSLDLKFPLPSRVFPHHNVRMNNSASFSSAYSISFCFSAMHFTPKSLKTSNKSKYYPLLPKRNKS